MPINSFDESTNCTDTAQLELFPNFDIIEDILCLIPMKITTIVENILKALIQCTDTMGIDLTKLFSVTTNKVISMVVINEGTVALLKTCYES